MAYQVLYHTRLHNSDINAMDWEVVTLADAEDSNGILALGTTWGTLLSATWADTIYATKWTEPVVVRRFVDPHYHASKPLVRYVLRGFRKWS